MTARSTTTRWVTAVVAGVVLLGLIVGIQLPVSAATRWRTKATVMSHGAGYWDTSSSASTVVNRPRAIRVGFATPGESRRVNYDFSLFCDNKSKSVYGRKVTTDKRGFEWVTIQDFSRRLGPYCDVSVYASMGNTSGLKLKIQAKQS